MVTKCDSLSLGDSFEFNGHTYRIAEFCRDVYTSWHNGKKHADEESIELTLVRSLNSESSERPETSQSDMFEESKTPASSKL